QGVGGCSTEDEREKASQRTRDAMRRRAEKGGTIGGRPLYGYKAERSINKDTNKPETTITIDRSEAKIVERIFKRRAEGAGNYRIAHDLMRDHIPSPSGGKAWHTAVLRDTVLT